MASRGYRPTLAQLRTFVTIAETKHFGTAAAKLSISQPSLSQALVALESGLGVQLIERSTRRVIVTPIGEALLPEAKATLDAADKFLSHAQGAEGSLTGPLSIGMIPTVAPYILPDFLQLMSTEFDDLEPRIVEAQTEQLVAQLRDGHLDVILIAVPSAKHGLVEVPVYTEKFVLAVPEGHELAGKKNLPLSVLQDLNLLLLDDGHCLRDQIVDLCRTIDVHPTTTRSAIAQASSLATVMQCVAGGLGATLIPESAVEWESNRPGIATATFAADVHAERTIGLAFRSSSHRAEEFSEFGAIIAKAFAAAI
ncbi:LysR substrate-binding domain-containing protein [Corynebacterium sp. H130]|uniref:LysR substrate-binding domain-containing protein n=1 Tax=Corynebacterium sp. H130 TaxID=3133444 RepID=UPI0030B51D3D